MDSSSSDTLEYSGTACALQPSPPQQSNFQPPPNQSRLQPPTHSDQLQEVLDLAEAVATDKLHLTPDDEPIKFTISRESWLKLQEDPNFDLYTERKLFRVFFDSSRCLVTIMPPPSFRHQAFVGFLTELAYKAKFAMTPTLAAKILINSNSAIPVDQSSQKQPDFHIDWIKSQDDSRTHTIVEVGVSQTLKDLRNLVPLYMDGDLNIQRVILIKFTEKPTFTCPKSIQDSQVFRIDEITGAIWCGNVKIIGETEVLWEIWERDTTGIAEMTFQETFAFGQIPSRKLPFLMISKGIYGDKTLRRGVDSPIEPQMMKRFWKDYWHIACWEDTDRRVLPLGILRAKGAYLSIQPSRVEYGALYWQVAVVVAVVVVLVAIVVARK
ncbi:hypothetical protein AYL99_11964 [Fonsecaea erecta]|uniref:Restriction endonuclease domain-containing protein n=1 Tax=Fonsecaea erecta TaxID=1367422 RepID=A0A178Z2V3_9EURO|nr:hypothetical protein AYL99_11964 [Fonsecaea erecta]OAP53841.1 hypothetical protein AYL99_11964 [Fonsecaea erecta]